VSFTRAAAVEVASREVSIDRDQIGTLHAMGYRALDKPEIAELHLTEWNESGGVRLQPSKVSLDEPLEAEMTNEGDALFMEYQVARAKMTPRDRWPYRVRCFAERWEAWKQDTGYIDFQDMIEIPLHEIDVAPGSPSVIFVDEAQDLSVLQWALLRKWGAQADDLIVVGDGDQVLYGWRGAAVEPFMTPLPTENIRTLKQSYRVPRTVLDVSQRWVRQIKKRTDITYNPRDAEGEVVRASLSLRNVDRLAYDLEQHESVMVLASCAYLLKPLLHELRRAGIPYHNPYRRKRGDWNPLRWGSTKRRTAVDRLLAFLRPDTAVWGDQSRMWTYRDVRDFAAILASGRALKRGGKKWLNDLPEEEIDNEAALSVLLEHVFTEAALDRAFELDMIWFLGAVLPSKRRLLEYPIAVAQRDKQALRDRPRIVTGTIHSVKGGEASTVYLFPDLSTAGMRSWVHGGDRRDGIIRQFYVGMTRARETLVLCAPSTRKAVNFALT